MWARPIFPLRDHEIRFDSAEAGPDCPPAAQGSDLGYVCVRGGAAEVDPRGLRLSRVSPMPPVPPGPYHVACVEATQRLCGSHTRAVAVPQQHIVAVEKPRQLCWPYILLEAAI